MMRALAKHIRKMGIDPHKFATAVRIDTLFNNSGISPEDRDSLIEKFLGEIYRAKWDPAQAIGYLRQFLDNAQAFGNGPADHAAFVNKHLFILNQWKRQVAEQQQKLAKLIHSRMIVKKNLNVFTRQEGVILSDVTERLTAVNLREENETLRKELSSYRSGQLVDKDELNKLNEQLIIPATEQQVLDVSNDVRINPSKYSHLFQSGIPQLDTNLKPLEDIPSAKDSEESQEQDNTASPNQPSSVDSNDASPLRQFSSK